MTSADSAKKVIEWAVRSLAEAIADDLKARCSEEARKAAERLWKECNPDDGVGGFSGNPYSRDQECNLKAMERSAKRLAEARDLMDFVKDRLCAMIPEKEGV